MSLSPKPKSNYNDTIVDPSKLLGIFRCRIGHKPAKLLQNLLRYQDEIAGKFSGMTNLLNKLLKMAPSPKNVPFIDFEKFRAFGRIPRFPDDSSITQPLGSIDRDSSLLVFVSHCWLRGAGAEELGGKPHPDNADGDKYKLLVAGIDKLKTSFAPNVKNVYLWIDFSCMNQDKKELSGDLEQYDQIVYRCDVVFTPIVDPDHEKWSFRRSWKHLFDEYQAPGWCEGPHAYINRGWCRLEMLYASFLPAMENEYSKMERHRMFKAGLAHHCERGRRAHFVYGTKELAEGRDPCLLPPLQHSYLEKYHPMRGFLTYEKDIIHITKLCQTLTEMTKTFIVAGYEGERNNLGQKHGVGVETYENGGVFTGEYCQDKKQGLGAYRYVNGMLYQGEWANDMRNGRGFFQYACGDTFDGDWVDDLFNGQGVFKWSDGTVYNGQWKNGMKHGTGSYRYPDGTVYNGEWAADEKSGQGTLCYANGDHYQGEWKNDVKCGLGTFYYSGTGRSITSQWREDKMVQVE